MAANPRIAFIGAGSTVFMKNIIGDVLQREAISGSTIALMDINPERLKESEIVAGKLIVNGQPVWLAIVATLAVGIAAGIGDDATFAEASGEAVSLVGWSLGGVYARELAKELPQHVRSVITLGTPFAGSHKSTNAWRLYELTSGRRIAQEVENFDLPAAPPVPTTSIYSRTDGVVAWPASLQAPSPANPHTENVEVFASHIGLGLNPSAWWVVADRLAQAPGAWKPFERTGKLQQWVFPDPTRP